MSTGLLADNQQALQFKKPSSAPADYQALPSANFPSTLSNFDLHTLNRHSPQFLSLDTAQFASKLCSSYGELQSHAPPAQHLSASLCSFDGEPQTNTASANPKPAASPVNHAFSLSQPSCMDYVGSSSSSTSTPRSCTSNVLQMELGDGDAVSQGAFLEDLRASECDFSERIHELRAALLRRSVSKPGAAVMQSSPCELQVKKWTGQLQAVGSQKDEIGGNSLGRNGHLQAYKHDIEGDPHDYLGSLRAAASSFGGITYQTNQDSSAQDNNLLDRANHYSVGSPNQGCFSNQNVSAVSFTDQGKQAPSLGGGAFDQSQGKPSLGGLHEVKQAPVGRCTKAASQASAANGLSQANLQGAAFVNGFEQACTSSSNQERRGNYESSAGSCIEKTTQDSLIIGFSEAPKPQGFPSSGEFSQVNYQAALSDLSKDDQPSVGRIGQQSMGGLAKVHQASVGTFSQAHQNSACGFNQATHADSVGSFDSEANKASSGTFYANQASVGGINQAVLLKKEGNSEFGDVQSAQYKSRSNGDLTEIESLQVEEGSNDLLQADSYLGDLQASIMVQAGSLQRFLPSNEEEEGEFAEEELQLGGALFGCDEFRMYEFKVRLCMRERSHDWTQCPFAHPGEKARRRDPRLHHYSAVPCPDFRRAACKRGDACQLSHGVFECWLHPSRYRTQICKDGKQCKRKVCFFAHSPSQFRAISSNSASQIQNVSLPLAASNVPDLSTLDGSSLRLPIQLVQHLDPRYYVQALLKHDNHQDLIHNHLRQHQHGGAEATAAPPISFDSSPLRLAMAYGLPINLDASALEGFNLTNSNGQLAVSPRSLNIAPRNHPFDGSTFLQHGNGASASGFPCCKGAPTTNYSNLANFSGISMPSHSSYGASPHLQSDGSHIRSLQAAPIDGIPRQYVLNGEVCSGFIPINEALALGARNNITTQHMGSGVHLHTHPTAPTLSLTDPAPPGMSSNIAGWNNPSLLQRSAPSNFQAAPSPDAVSQAQAVLAAHALAQNLPSDYHGRSMPSSPMSLHARHHLDGTRGAVNSLGAQLNNLELVNEQHLQNAMRGLDSPQAMSQLIASIQQLEMRCANAEMKNSLMMAQAAHMGSALNSNPNNVKAHQAESWDGHENEGPSYQKLDRVGSMKGARVYGMLRQDAATPMPDQKGSFDLGWVNELI